MKLTNTRAAWRTVSVVALACDCQPRPMTPKPPILRSTVKPTGAIPDRAANGRGS
jgi:hypothetical protein